MMGVLGIDLKLTCHSIIKLLLRIVYMYNVLLQYSWFNAQVLEIIMRCCINIVHTIEVFILNYGNATKQSSL